MTSLCTLFGRSPFGPILTPFWTVLKGCTKMTVLAKTCISRDLPGVVLKREGVEVP